MAIDYFLIHFYTVFTLHFVKVLLNKNIRYDDIYVYDNDQSTKNGVTFCQSRPCTCRAQKLDHRGCGIEITYITFLTNGITWICQICNIYCQEILPSILKISFLYSVRNRSHSCLKCKNVILRGGSRGGSSGSGLFLTGVIVHQVYVVWLSSLWMWLKTAVTFCDMRAI